MLKISQILYDQLRAHGEETYPNECCGIMLGKSDGTTTADTAITVHQLIRAGNTRTDSAHNRYHIAPCELIRAQREARNQGLDIVGFYHSHPDHPAHWSTTHFAKAFANQAITIA
jgi:proteasome lid subunit RPN8/RPN11